MGGLLSSVSAGGLQDLAYTYDKNGNVLTITDALAAGGAQTQTFTYDALNRIKTADATGGTNGLYAESYDYDAASGNLSLKNELGYYYDDPAHAHAVTSLSNGNSYGYDPNGNMITRNINGQNFDLGYDAENRLVSVAAQGVGNMVNNLVTPNLEIFPTPTVSSLGTEFLDSTDTLSVGGIFSHADFIYDSNGQRVKSVLTTDVGVTTTYFVGNYYEVTDGVVTKYYYAGAQRIAMRKNGTLNYILGDHLGSTSIVTDAAGALVSKQLYTPWGETRSSSGLSPTQYQYTGQYSHTADFGLMFYNARWYDPALGRFAQADSIIPDGVQGLDRYAYANNAPVKYTDPSGHCSQTGDNWCFEGDGGKTLNTYTRAAILMESPFWGKSTRWGWAMRLINRDRYDSIGRAKISDAIMEGDYGEPVDVDHPGQTGLGLRDGSCSWLGCAMNQGKPVIATLAMRTRISMRLDVCAQHNCTNTDMFMTALLAADERITPQTLTQAFKSPKYKSENESVTLNWEKFLDSNWEPTSDGQQKNIQLINLFSKNVKQLQSQNYYVPEIDWVYIVDLTQ